MRKELKIKTPTVEFRAFLQDGFFGCPPVKNIHRHNYSELHFILDGGATFIIDNKSYRVKSGDMLVIPPRVMHAIFEKDEKTRHTAFQIDCKEVEFSVHTVDDRILSPFFEAINDSQRTNDYTELSAFMALFCCKLPHVRGLQATEIDNYPFLINEFFSLHYSEDVHLCDLAKALHLSERHAERLVILHMGKTFRKTLIETRLAMANQLARATELSLEEIAKYVGYRSYAGFWKAMRRGEDLHQK